MYAVSTVFRRSAVCAAAAATTLALVSAPTAQAQPQLADPGVTVVLSGLNNPYDVQFGTLGLMFVAENGGAQITAAIPALGVSLPIVKNLPGIASATSPFGQLLFVTGEAEPQGDNPAPPQTGGLDGASLYAANLFGPPRKIADLTAYELAHNPDGQQQFGPGGEPLDALSNPFRVLKRGFFGDTYIADGGANDVLAVDFFGTVRTLFAPPNITTGACADAPPNNDPEHPGCDSVPTGLAFGPDGLLYVSGFSAGAPGEGRVYVLDPGTGALQRTITGLDGPSGVAVGDDGSVYVTEVLYGAEGEGPPPEGTEPQGPPPGRIVKVAPNGDQSAAMVPLPLGIAFHDGALYSTALSLAGPGAGQVVRVGQNAFSPLTESPSAN